MEETKSYRVPMIVSRVLGSFHFANTLTAAVMRSHCTLASLVMRSARFVPMVFVPLDSSDAPAFEPGTGTSVVLHRH